MGKLTEEDRAEILIDASVHGDEEAARMHGTHPRHISAMRNAMAGGPNVSGVGKVSVKVMRNQLKGRIRDAQLHAQLALAQASEREAKEDRPDPQRTMACASAAKTYAEIEAAHEWMDEQLALMEEQRAKLRARDTTADEPEEPRQLEAPDEDEA